ncbi:hypothetical protein [Pseudoalteromonas shioyasakiensis]|uniref:hypothetical protein n=1 Tax=Pseudoalteromonas shioyasakiensis TaxID=1190813 RepID=UPI0020CC1931|nr:hypothetical protein [Pseudoalteromonas shioyasakiensis]
MRLLIFILALTSAFFSFADDSSLPYDPNDLRAPDSQPFYYFECQGDNNNMEIASEFNDIKVCQPFWTTYIERSTDAYISSGSYSSVGPIVWTSSNRWSYEYTPCRYGDCDTFGTDTPRTANGQSPGRYLRTEWQHTCPPEQHPEYEFPVMKDPQPTDPAAAPMQCAKLLDGEPEPEPDPDTDPDCPAPTDNDPWVFGTGQQQTVCFDNPDGSQCSIETDSNGGYSMPVSYGSQEPVACTEVEPTDPDPTDPDPTDPDPTDPDPTDPDPTDPDPTDPDPTDPDPTDPDPTDPDPTDDTDQTEIIDALNQSNDNLDAINNNLVDGFYESNGLLSDLMDGIEGLISGQDDANGHLQDISDNTEGILDALNDDGGEQPDCIGDLCNQDIEEELSELDQEFQDWMEEDVQIAPEVTTLTGKFKSFVSQNFAGFTGSCQPFTLDVSVAGDSKTITVSQHCEPYETYFKPLVEWLIWTFTAIALLNISSQSFRAFSSI